MSAHDSRDGRAPHEPAEFPSYLGPYEAWNFGVGRAYALPFMRHHWKYISALAELGAYTKIPPDDMFREIAKAGWVPTFWKGALGGSFIPFVADNSSGGMPTLEELPDVLRDALINIITPLL